MTTKRNKTKQQATIQTKIMLKLFCHFCDLYHSTPYITVMTGLFLSANSLASRPQLQTTKSKFNGSINPTPNNAKDLFRFVPSMCLFLQLAMMLRLSALEKDFHI